MNETNGSNLREIEQQELDRVLELLGRGTRPGRLLAYMETKHFQEHKSQLTEFDIATEVFGRSPKSFDPTQDAVVRVEAHRLRKKLREIYEKDGHPHGLEISLPPGSYAPKVLTASAEPEEVAPSPSDGDSSATTSEQRHGSRALIYGLGIAALACIALVVWNVREPTQQREAANPTAAIPPDSPRLPEGVLQEVHLMAGYSGSEVIDNSGTRWTPDRFHNGGGEWPRDGSYGFIRGTSRPFLFSNWRTGEFSYDVPLPQGSYELRMFFISQNHVGDEKLAGFNVLLNGNPLMTGFDVNISALGVDVADEQVFRDVTPDEDGFVRVRFSNQVSTATLNALEIVPGTPGRLRPIRIITQPTSFVDHKGQRWRADDYYLNGIRSTERRKVSGTDDPELFAGERYGHFQYSIPVDARGRYTVVLHFAEFYFGPQLGASGGVGSRVFNVFCNGQTLLKDFDIFKEAGSLRVVTKSFQGIAPSAQGKIKLTFEPVANNATVSAIEIIEEPVSR